MVDDAYPVRVQPNSTASIRHRDAWQHLTKVPRVTIFFWIIKILTTAMGEATSDYMVHRFNPYLAVLLGFILLIICLWLQFKVKKYIAWVYWLAALAVSIAGTMGADVLHVGFHIPYIVSTIFYAVLLVIIFAYWQKSEGTLSFHSIYTRRREALYWAAVLATFAFGTALGDLAAYTLNLGFFSAALIFTAIFAATAIGYFLFKLNAIFAFWFAYIMTRPMGASFADWAAKPVSLGGLGHGDGAVSLTLFSLIILFVTYLSISGVDLPSRSNT